MAKAKKKARTQVCFLLDETQSMLERKEETIKGFNGYLEDLKKDKGDEVLFTFTTFNKGGVKTHYKAAPVKDVKPLDDKTYQPQNWTPLHDAIGTTICAIKDAVDKDDLVIFTILTDGEENSSHEYTLQAIKDLIKKHEADGWKFVFLGVGVDAFRIGGSIGLSANSTFDVGAQNTGVMYATMSMGTDSLRMQNVAMGSVAARGMNMFSDADRSKLKDK